MIAPLPKARSIWATAVSIAFFLSKLIKAPHVRIWVWKNGYPNTPENARTKQELRRIFSGPFCLCLPETNRPTREQISLQKDLRVYSIYRKGGRHELDSTTSPDQPGCSDRIQSCRPSRRAA